MGDVRCAFHAVETTGCVRSNEGYANNICVSAGLSRYESTSRQPPGNSVLCNLAALASPAVIRSGVLPPAMRHDSNVANDSRKAAKTDDDKYQFWDESGGMEIFYHCQSVHPSGFEQSSLGYLGTKSRTKRRNNLSAHYFGNTSPSPTPGSVRTIHHGCGVGESKLHGICERDLRIGAFTGSPVVLDPTRIKDMVLPRCSNCKHRQKQLVLTIRTLPSKRSTDPAIQQCHSVQEILQAREEKMGT